MALGRVERLHRGRASPIVVRDRMPTRILPFAPDLLPAVRRFSQTMWLRSSDGEWRHVHVTAFPLIGEHDTLFGAMTIFWQV